MTTRSALPEGGFDLAILDIHADGRYRMKDAEKAAVFAEICRKPGTTRTAIIKNLELRPTSVSHEVNELARDRLVLERKDRTEKRQGRPEISLYPNKNRFTAVAVHISSRTMKAVLINAFEECMATEEVLLERKTTNGEFVEKFAKAVDSLKARIPEDSDFLGICLSVPGFMDTEKRRWIFAARWPALKKLSFDLLEKAAKTPISLHRVLDSGLEYLLARDKELRATDALLVHWGYGIGASYANGGKVLSSSVGGVCEFGHWKLSDAKPKKCSCGASGCLETEAALWSIVPDLRKDYPDAPEKEESFHEYVMAHRDMASHPVLTEAVKAMSRGIAMLFTTLFPKRVFVYGPLALIPEIKASLKEEIVGFIPDFARPYFKIEFLDSAYRGEQFGSTRKMFLDAYRDYLRAGGEKRSGGKPPKRPTRP